MSWSGLSHITLKEFLWNFIIIIIWNDDIALSVLIATLVDFKHAKLFKRTYRGITCYLLQLLVQVANTSTYISINLIEETGSQHRQFLLEFLSVTTRVLECNTGKMSTKFLSS